MALFLLAVVTLLVQELAFVACGHPSAASKVLLRARGGGEEEDDDYVFQYMPTKLAELKIGQELDGVITFVSDRVALADVGVEKVGLIPASKMADVRVDNPQDVVKVGDSVKVWVTEVFKAESERESKLVLALTKNKVFDRRSLGDQPDMDALKAALEADGDAVDEEGKPKDKWISGMVFQKREFGCFVAFRVPGVAGTAQGLVYKTEVKGDPDVMDKVKVRVINIDDTDRISLSMQSSAGVLAPFYDMVGQWLDGTVKNFANFGAFVEVPSPEGGTVDGLLGNRDIKKEGVEDPAEELEEGQIVKVRVKNVSEKGLALSLLEEQ